MQKLNCFRRLCKCKFGFVRRPALPDEMNAWDCELGPTIETSNVVFLTPDPIIYTIDADEDETTVINQLTLSFKSGFVNKISLGLDNGEIDLLPDQIKIIGVLDASEALNGNNGTDAMKSRQATEKKKQLFLAAEFNYEGTQAENELTKSSLNSASATSFSPIGDSVVDSINESDMIQECKIQNTCSVPEKFNFVSSENAPKELQELYSQSILLKCTENCKYAERVENAEEEEESILTALSSLNVGDGDQAANSQSALITNFAEISSDELANAFGSRYRPALGLNGYIVTVDECEFIERKIEGTNKTVKYLQQDRLFLLRDFEPDFEQADIGIVITVRGHHQTRLLTKRSESQG